jgi:hypothetical protein
MEALLWTPQELANVLKLKNSNTIGQMIHDEKITEADGWIKVGRLNRFVAHIVIERLEAGLFAKGLDKEGRPVTARKLRAA